jgi:putative serine protease PepD
MWSLAANLTLGLALASPPLTAADQAAWEGIRRSVITITVPLGGRMGVAALIDERGLFLADRAGLTGTTMTGKTSDGLVLVLDLVTVDEPTQLALLRARQWHEAQRRPVAVAPSREVKGRTVIVVLPSGPIRGEVVPGDRVGVLQPTLRYLPLSEIRFETTPGRVGGALAFTAGGKLAGVLSATLEAYPRPAPGRGRESPAAEAGRFGPLGLTVGYGLSTELLARVVEGFRSPSARVRHPYIGAFFRDGEGGAQVDRVVEGSPSGRAGLQAGDLIVRVDGLAVEDAIELAATLFRLQVGQRIAIEVLRGPGRERLTLDVEVGTQ